MGLFYSKSTNGFYATEIHGSNIPADAVQISLVEHQALLAAQSTGKIITADEDGKPIAAEKTYSFAEILANKLTALANYRYQKETAGITVSGTVIATDRSSQAMLTGAQTYFSMNPSATVDWKGENGWIEIDQATALALAQLVGTHVQACFTNERTHAEAIALLTTAESIEAYDFTTGWPT